MADFKCWTCGRPTEYDEDGYWRCPHCNEYFYEGYDEDGDPCDDEDALSVYDAALIWASKGKDEDYMFGYSEEELEDAL